MNLIKIHGPEWVPKRILDILEEAVNEHLDTPENRDMIAAHIATQVEDYIHPTAQNPTL